MMLEMILSAYKSICNLHIWRCSKVRKNVSRFTTNDESPMAKNVIRYIKAYVDLLINMYPSRIACMYFKRSQYSISEYHNGTSIIWGLTLIWTWKTSIIFKDQGILLDFEEKS